MSKCTVKHIPMPIPDVDWKCPTCGAGNDYFYIQESQGSPDCELFHSGDAVGCDSCGGGWSLTTIIRKWAKKKNMVRCPHCKGTGVVEGEHR